MTLHICKPPKVVNKIAGHGDNWTCPECNVRWTWRSDLGEWVWMSKRP